MLFNATILFLRAQDVSYEAGHDVPQRCKPGVCVDGGVREQVDVPIEADGRRHDFLSSGFEYVRLNEARIGAAAKIRRVRTEGLSGGEGPSAAVASGVRVLPQLLGLGGPAPQAADAELARALEGASAYSLRGALSASFRCSGLIIRRSGPALSPPLYDINSADGSGAAASLDHAGEQIGIELRRRPLESAPPRAPPLHPTPPPRRTPLLPGDVRLPAHSPHIDQDAGGEPLRSMGLSALFRWVPGMRLLNVWLPLEASPTRPLALMDSRSLDRAAELVRYRAAFKINVSAPTDVFLLRHAPTQRWHFAADLAVGDAIVFDAMRTAHASFEMRGERRLAELRAALRGWLDARRHDEAGPAGGGCELVDADAARARHGAPIGPMLPGLVDESVALLSEVCAARRVEPTGEPSAQLEQRVRSLLLRSERLSLEMRCAALVVPKPSAAGCARAAAFAFAFAVALRGLASFATRAADNLGLRRGGRRTARRRHAHRD